MNGTTNGSDDAGALSVAALILAILFGLWYFSDRILDFWRDLIVPVAHVWALLCSTEVGEQIARLLGRDPAKIRGIPAYLASLSPEQLKAYGYGEAKRYGDYVHRFTSLIVAPMIIYIGYRCFRHSRLADPIMFRVTTGIPAITQLIKQMPGREWMADVVDASAKPLFDGKVSLQAPITPWRFAELYGLAKTDNQGALIEFDKEKAATVYAGTLGQKFTDLKALEAGKYGRAWRALMDQIPPSDRAAAGRAASKGHLYEKTVIIALLRQMSRVMIIDYGYLMFMRHQDVAFFDAISTCGRRTAFAAGAGIMGQFRHEVAMHNATKGQMPPEQAAGAQWAADWLEEALRTDPYERPWVESDAIWESFDPFE